MIDEMLTQTFFMLEGDEEDDDEVADVEGDEEEKEGADDTEAAPDRFAPAEEEGV